MTAKERLLHAFPVRAIKRYLDSQGPNSATLIAWNALFAVFPIVLVTITVLGLVLQNPTIAQNVQTAVVDALPGKNAQGQVLDALNGVKHNTGVFAIVGFAGLLWGGSALFGAIEQGLSTLYGRKPRDFVRQKLMSFAMIFLFTALAVPLVLSSALLPALQSLNFVPAIFTSGPAGLIIQIAAGILDGTLIFLAIYYVVPNRRQHLRFVLPGAITAGVLLEAFTFVFPLYVRLAGGFNAYGATFALFFLLMTYMFFLGQITVIGGVVNAEYELSREPEAADVPTTTLPGKGQRERRVVQDRTR
jgi:membrane protein